MTIEHPKAHPLFLNFDQESCLVSPLLAMPSVRSFDFEGGCSEQALSTASFC